MSVGDNPHLLLGRIRFLNRCIECFKKSEQLPECLCYVPREVCYKICKDSSSSSSATSGASAGGSITGKTLISVFENPHQTPHIKKLCKYNIEPKKGTCIRTTGEEYRNSQGLWVKITKVSLRGFTVNSDDDSSDATSLIVLQDPQMLISEPHTERLQVQPRVKSRTSCFLLCLTTKVWKAYYSTVIHIHFNGREMFAYEERKKQNKVFESRTLNNNVS